MTPTSMQTPMASKLKVALACPGVGLEQRGFERMFYDLFHLVVDNMDITLYKGGGVSSQKEIVLRFANRNGWIAKYLPLHKLAGRSPISLECLTFCAALLFAIRKKNYDVVHVIDPPLARLLYQFRNRFRLKFRILYTQGCNMLPEHYPPADHLHHVSQATFNGAVKYGLPEDYMTLVPVGFYPERKPPPRCDLPTQKGVLMRFSLKTVLVTGLFMVLPAVAAGQSTVGFRGGLSVASLGGDDAEDLDSRTGLRFGGFFNVPVSDVLGVQVGAGFVQKGASAAASSHLHRIINNVGR